MKKLYDACWLQKFPELSPEKNSVPSKTAELELQSCLSVLEIDDGFSIEVTGTGDEYSIDKRDNKYVITGGEPGVLYGAYDLIFRLAQGRSINTPVIEKPAFKLRMLNHWDNANGSIERGYAGGSIFFLDNALSYDPQNITQYARLLASVGINAVCINNVNVALPAVRLLTEEMLPQVSELAALFRPFGIRLLLSVNFASPMIISGLETANPQEEEVARWWKERFEIVYRYVPDFVGIVIKADSENQPGPYLYNLDHAQGSKAFAEALKPFGGIVIWRCFVYNCKQDWRDTQTDRPKAAYDNYYPLDGKFEDNVILQVKNGPYDFQVREPVSPLLGAMDKTEQALEFQLTQEYTGHQIDLFYMPPQWKEVFEFDTMCGEKSRIADMAGNKISSIAAVPNIGNNFNRTGHKLAQANLFAYGRFAWNPLVDIPSLTYDWIELTFGTDSVVKETVYGMLMSSRDIYESYTAPLGLCWMVRTHLHYGPDPEGYEFSLWGTYHRANRYGIGIDRTSNGTGYTKQYSPAVCEMYDSIETCPQELLLFFHRLNYDFVMKDGRTLLQYIYDTRFEGVGNVEKMISEWKKLEGLIPADAFENVSERLTRQLQNAQNWRDVLNTYFYRLTGISDAKGRKIYE